jgi:hypothetical protein
VTPGTVGRDQDLHVRPVRIRWVDFRDDGNLASVQSHEIADRVDADKLCEPTDQVLIELPSVASL